MPIVHGDLGMTRIRHRDGQRNQPGPHVYVSHCDANIAAPDVDDRRAAAIVAGVHAEKIFLSEFGMQRYNPIWPFLIGTALVRPEGWRAAIVQRVQRVGIVGPAFDSELARTSIGITDIKECHRREFIVDRDGDFFSEWSGFPHYDEPLSRSEGVAHPLALL